MAKRASARPGPAAAPSAEATWSKDAVSFRLTADRRSALASLVEGCPRRPSVTAALDLALEWAVAARMSEPHPKGPPSTSSSAPAAALDVDVPTESDRDACWPSAEPESSRSMSAGIPSVVPANRAPAARGSLDSGFLESDLVEVRDASIRALERLDANSALLSRLDERTDACFALLARLDDRLSELCETISTAAHAAANIDVEVDGESPMGLRAWLDAEAAALPKPSLLVLAKALPGSSVFPPRASVERVAAAGLRGPAARGLPRTVSIDKPLSKAFEKALGRESIFLLCQLKDGAWTVAAHQVADSGPGDRLCAFAI